MTNYVEVNGHQVIDLTPDYNRPLALVDLSVLNKLTMLLQKQDFGIIRHNHRENIMHAENLLQLIEISEDFIAFHRTVNLIREITAGDVNQIQDDFNYVEESNRR